MERVKTYLVEHGVPADHLDTKALGDEHKMTSAEVKALIEQDTTLSDETRQKILKNLPTIVLANNWRVDVTLSTTGQQGVRGLPFNAEDASTLIRRSVEENKRPRSRLPNQTEESAQTVAGRSNRSKQEERAAQTACSFGRSFLQVEHEPSNP